MPAEPSTLMCQYYGVKQQFPQALVLFRIGGFYELRGQAWRE